MYVEDKVPRLMHKTALMLHVYIRSLTTDTSHQTGAAKLRWRESQEVLGCRGRTHLCGDEDLVLRRSGQNGAHKDPVTQSMDVFQMNGSMKRNMKECIYLETHH